MTDYVSERRRRRVSESPEVVDPASQPTTAGQASPGSADAPPSSVPFPDGGGVWLPIDDYARSGVRVFVRDSDGQVSEAKYYATRRYDSHKNVWVSYSRWADCNQAMVSLSWTPVQYRKFDSRIDLNA